MVDPEVECPPECPNHKTMKAAIERDDRIDIATTGLIIMPDENFNILRGVIKKLQAEGKRPDPTIAMACIKNKK